MKMADKVASAVMVTDKAELPFASDDRKFEMFPPGQDATSIIPSATDGVGLIIITNKNVMAGNTKN